MQLIDLRRPPVSINDPSQRADGLNALNSILGQIAGQSAVEQKTRLDNAAKNANDLSALVRKRQPGGATSEKHSDDSIADRGNTKRLKTEESPPSS
jgi:HAT1-interacting factor 1